MSDIALPLSSLIPPHSSGAPVVRNSDEWGCGRSRQLNPSIDLLHSSNCSHTMLHSEFPIPHCHNHGNDDEADAQIPELTARHHLTHLGWKDAFCVL
eukprot:2999035-Amphidinium_carterae.2